MRKLVYGVGNNDAQYTVKGVVDGKQVLCPYYRRWFNMLTRCYDIKQLARQPTYIGCTVCDEWLTFSNFKNWMARQGWEGKELDKDILVQGNKVYSPATCIFVSHSINNLLASKGGNRGSYPQGVSFNKLSGKFVAQCSVDGKNKGLGYYKTIEAAQAAYRDFKYKVIRKLALEQQEPLRGAMLSLKVI